MLYLFVSLCEFAIRMWLRSSWYLETQEVCICLQIREYHRRHPAARVIDAGEEYEQMFKEDPVLDFSGEVFISILLLLA